MCKIGTTFQWLGRTWTVFGFNAKQAMIRNDKTRTTIDLALLEKML